MIEPINRNYTMTAPAAAPAHDHQGREWIATALVHAVLRSVGLAGLAGWTDYIPANLLAGRWYKQEHYSPSQTWQAATLDEHMACLRDTWDRTKRWEAGEPYATPNPSDHCRSLRWEAILPGQVMYNQTPDILAGRRHILDSDQFTYAHPENWNPVDWREYRATLGKPKPATHLPANYIPPDMLDPAPGYTPAVIPDPQTVTYSPAPTGPPPATFYDEPTSSSTPTSSGSTPTSYAEPIAQQTYTPNAADWLPPSPAESSTAPPSGSSSTPGAAGPAQQEGMVLIGSPTFDFDSTAQRVTQHARNWWQTITGTAPAWPWWVWAALAAGAYTIAAGKHK